MALMTSSGGVVGIKGANACESISGVCKALRRMEDVVALVTEHSTGNLGKE